MEFERYIFKKPCRKTNKRIPDLADLGVPKPQPNVLVSVLRISDPEHICVNAAYDVKDVGN